MEPTPPDSAAGLDDDVEMVHRLPDGKGSPPTERLINTNDAPESADEAAKPADVPASSAAAGAATHVQPTDNAATSLSNAGAPTAAPVAPATAARTGSEASGPSLKDKVRMIQHELAIDPATGIMDTLRKANECFGLALAGTPHEQASALMLEMGL